MYIYTRIIQYHYVCKHYCRHAFPNYVTELKSLFICGGANWIILTQHSVFIMYVCGCVHVNVYLYMCVYMYDLQLARMYVMVYVHLYMNNSNTLCTYSA